jgi:hypothetical protein
MGEKQPESGHGNICDRHLRAMVAANEDRDIRKPCARPYDTPLLRLARALGAESPLARAAHDVGFRHDAVSFLTHTASQGIWGAVTALEALFSDGRRIEPRFAFAQLCGEERVAAGNEYRLVLSDAARLVPLNAAMAACARTYGGSAPPPALTVRRTDVRLLRAGPFGGETADLVAATLTNHGLSGLSAAWVVVHTDGADALRVSLDAAELFRWTWAAERVADLDSAAAGNQARILNWPWYFDRLVSALDGEPLPGSIAQMFLTGAWRDVGNNSRLRDALAAHPSLRDMATRLDREP